MASAFSALSHLEPARILFAAIMVSMSGIALLLSFIIGRRWVRSRYFERRDALASYFRQHWDELVYGVLPPRWCSEPLAREVMENILLDRIEVAGPQELAALVDCLRRCGALDRRIAEARKAVGWRKRRALVVLGRTRAPEAIPALGEGLDSADVETRIASLRGLGKIAKPEAALTILQRFSDDNLEAPWGVLKNSLLSCCTSDPGVLTRYVRVASGAKRELLARVLAEIADSAAFDELVAMVSDPSAELRGSAARGLGRAAPEIALAPLAELAQDKEWFVRLRAVVALAAFVDRGALPVLVRVLGDRNRLVRQRAAWGLIRSSHMVPDVVRAVVAAGDNYGLQAAVAELDRCGLYWGILEQVRQRCRDVDRLVKALEEARAKLQPQGQEAKLKQEVSVA